MCGLVAGGSQCLVVPEVLSYWEPRGGGGSEGAASLTLAAYPTGTASRTTHHPFLRFREPLGTGSQIVFYP